MTCEPPTPVSSEAAAVRQRTVRQLAKWLAVVLSLAILPGCAGFGRFRSPFHRDPMQGAVRPRFSHDPQLEEVVDHLNRNTERLQAWRANSVKIRANNVPLSGTLAVEQGQHLRLVVHSLAGNEVDLGSNDDVFWIWAKRMEPAYVYCRHQEIDMARQSLGVPFEPDWLMQALGVSPLDTRNLTMQIDSKAHRARLVQPVVSAHGYPMEKVVLVDLTRGVILEHAISDASGHKIAEARLEDYHFDKASGAVLPRLVRLDWPQNEMCLVLNLGQIEVNPTSIPSQIWDMPKMPGVQMVNLGAEARPGTRTAVIPDAGVQLHGLETFEDPQDVSGRVRMTNVDPETELEEPIEHRTAPIHRPPAIEWWDEN